MSAIDEGTPGGANRREFLRKVGLYGAPTVLVGGSLLEAAVRAGVASAAGAESCSSVAISSVVSASLVSSPGTGCEAPPLTLLQGDLAILESLTVTGFITRFELADAIAVLKLATAPGNWIDPSDLVVKRGDLVFALLADATLALELVQNPPAAITGVISDIVNAASTLANSAVTNATSASAKQLLTANNALSAGAAAGTRGNYVAAVVQYGVAWAAVSH